MPDGFKIPIDVQIATSGAPAGEAAITTQSTAAKSLGDVFKKVHITSQELGKSIEDIGGAAAKADPQLSQLINLQRAQISMAIGQTLGQAASALRQLSQDSKGANKDMYEALVASATAADGLSTSMTLAAQGFAVGGPLGAGIGATVGIISGPLKAAFADMNRSLAGAEISAKAAAAAVAKLGEARARLATEVMSEKLGAIYKEELDYLEQQVRALESRARIREAQRAADAAVSGPVSGPDAVSGQMASRLAAETAKVADAQEKLRILQEIATRAEDVAAMTEEQYTRGQATAARVKTALADARTATLAASSAETALQELELTSEATRLQILAASRDTMHGLAADANAAITAEAQAALDVIRAKAEEQGGRLGTLAKGSFDSLAKVLTDKIPDASQTADILQAMKNFAGSSEGRDSAIFAAFNTMTANMDKLASGYADVLSKINGQRAQINAIYESRK